MTPRVLVLYGTTEGQTARVAGAIAGAVRSAGASVEVVNADAQRDPNPTDFSGVIVAASVHAGSFQRPVVRWAAQHADALARLPTAFICVCLAVVNRTPDVDRDLQRILDRFYAMTEWLPIETKIVAGALQYRKYGWLKRWMMRRIVAKQGGDTDTSRDYEYTDWDDLRRFAERFGRRVGAGTVADAS